MKTCTKCGEEKALSEYHKHKTGRFGVAPACNKCKAATDKKYREANKDKIAAWHKKYGEEKKEKIAANGKKYREDHPERKAATGKKYREANKEKIAEYHKKYCQENKEKVAAQKKKWQDIHRWNDHGLYRSCCSPIIPDYRVEHNLIPTQKGYWSYKAV